MPGIDCRPEPRTPEVVEVAEPASRIPGEGSGFTLRVGLRLRVLSDYLFIWSGRVKPYGIERVLNRLRGRAPEGRLRDVFRWPSEMLWGAEPVKDFYRVVNPRTGRLQPAIPGSSLKGAARARIELASLGEKGRVVADFLYSSSNDGVVTLPPRGAHGWRHARIWCESIAEKRIRGDKLSVVEDIFGAVRQRSAFQARALFGTFYPVDPRLDCRLLRLDHGENVCAVPRGTVFEGEIRLVNVAPEEAGLVLYGLGFDKLLCRREPHILLGYSKYRCRELREGRKILMGVVGVEAAGFTPAPWDRERWLNSIGGDSPVGTARRLVEAAVSRYPGLRPCFDEVSRRLKLEPCSQ